jgi:putative ABC transport system substrate-binding protein
MPRKVGFLHNRTKASFQKHFAAFVGGLYDFVEEDNVIIVERWAGDDPGKSLEKHAAELAAGADVIVAAGGPQSVVAARKATTKIPIVFTPVTDPVRLGFVDSLDQPNTNATGIAGMTSELDVARLQLLCELLPVGEAATIGVLSNKERPLFEEQYEALKSAAPKDVTLVRMDVADFAQIEAAIHSFKKKFKSETNAQPALLVTADSLFNDLRKKVVDLAKGVPAIYQWREFAEAGGLMSFGPSIIEAYKKVGDYVGHILDGASPANLPVSFPDRFELVINLRVAQADRHAIPASLLSRAEFVRTRL